MKKSFYLFSPDDMQAFNDFVNSNRAYLLDIKFDMTAENETVIVEVLDEQARLLFH